MQPSGDRRVVLVLFVLSVGLLSSVSSAQDAEYYARNLRDYLASMQSMHFKAEFTGEEESGVKNMGAYVFSINGRYELDHDAERDLWKVRIDEDRVPNKKVSREDFLKLHVVDKRTIGKSLESLIDYTPREVAGGNVATYYQAQSQERSATFRYVLQKIDPRRHFAIGVPPKGAALRSEKRPDGSVVLNYHKAGTPDRTIYLSPQFGFLPVRIANEDPGWSTFSKGRFEKKYIDIEYEKVRGGHVIKSIRCDSASGKGVLHYSDADYRPDFAPDRFVVNVPSDASLIDMRLGSRINVHGEETEHAIVENMAAETFSAPSSRPAVQSSAGEKASGNPAATGSPLGVARINGPGQSSPYVLVAAAVTVLALAVISVVVIVKRRSSAKI